MTMLAARLPIIAACFGDKPAASANVKVATTVSPAPVTSNTSVLLNTGMGEN